MKGYVSKGFHQQAYFKLSSLEQRPFVVDFIRTSVHEVKIQITRSRLSF